MPKHNQPRPGSEIERVSAYDLRARGLAAAFEANSQEHFASSPEEFVDAAIVFAHYFLTGEVLDDEEDGGDESPLDEEGDEYAGGNVQGSIFDDPTLPEEELIEGTSSGQTVE